MNYLLLFVKSPLTRAVGAKFFFLAVNDRDVHYGRV